MEYYRLGAWVCSIYCVLLGLFLGAAQGQTTNPWQRDGEDSTDEASSLWDIVEAGVGAPATGEASEAVTEHADMRFSEQEMLKSKELPGVPDATLYVDPVSAVEKPEEASEGLDLSAFDIPVMTNSDVERWMAYFQGRGRRHFQRWLSRETKYRPMIDRHLEARDLPLDLFYLSMIESGLSPHARSTASAVGLWQFIEPTARAYGLRVDYWVDERRDPELATRAATKMLTDLQAMFGDWYLSWAAYNTGSGRLRSAMRKHGTSDYWELVRLEALSSETRNYVPKLLAAAIIGKNPEQYGFTEIKPQRELKYSTVEVEGSVTLDVIAGCAGVKESTIVALNPAMLRGATPPRSTTRVHIPVGTRARFQKAFGALSEADRLTYRRHRVVSGESLGSISTRYGVPTQALIEFNRITEPDRIGVGVELVVPIPRGSELPAAASASRSDQAGSSEAVLVTVRSGQTLGSIAKKHGVSVSELVAWNQLNDANHVFVGQKIRVYSAAAQESRGQEYTVVPGDSLYGIAEHHGCTVEELKAWNGLRSSTIQPGQVLRLGVRE